jgi:hypothetical protein
VDNEMGSVDLIDFQVGREKEMRLYESIKR